MQTIPRKPPVVNVSPRAIWRQGYLEGFDGLSLRKQPELGMNERHFIDGWTAGNAAWLDQWRQDQGEFDG